MESIEECQAVIDFLDSHPPNKTIKKLILKPLSIFPFDFTSSEKKWRTMMTDLQSQSTLLLPIAGQLRAIASITVLARVKSQLEFELEVQSTKTRICTDGLKAFLFAAAVSLWLLSIYGTALNLQSIGNTVQILASLLLVVGIVSVIFLVKSLNEQSIKRRYYIHILELAQLFHETQNSNEL